MPKPLRLESFRIDRQYKYRDSEPDRYTGHVEFAGDLGKIDFPLHREVSARLLEFLKPLIAEMGAKAAQEIAASVSDAVDNGKEVIQLPEQAAS